jgi:hypothetical protein
MLTGTTRALVAAVILLHATLGRKRDLVTPLSSTAQTC